MNENKDRALNSAITKLWEAKHKLKDLREKAEYLEYLLGDIIYDLRELAKMKEGGT